jgi:hypothetical protein
MIALIGIGGGPQYKRQRSRDLQQVPNSHRVGHKFCKDLQPLKKFEQGL